MRALRAELLAAAVNHKIRAALVVMAAVLAAPATALADTAPPGKVLSHYEEASHNSLARDCGFSQRLPSNPGLSLWLFCDTPIVPPSGPVRIFIPGSTAAVGPFRAGEVPTRLSEIPSPPRAVGRLPTARAPQPFLPTPAGLFLPDGRTPCGAGGRSYAASWISGVTREPASADPSKLLISFTDVCVIKPNGPLLVERFGLAEYRPADNRITAITRVFSAARGRSLAPDLRLGSPVFDGAFLFLFSSTCDRSSGGACVSGRVFLAQVPARPADWRRSAAYQLRGPVIPAARPVGVSVNSFSSVGQGLVLVEETSIGGDFRVWHAGSPAAAWRQGTPGRVPCSGGRGLDLCRALIGHPELSTTNRLLVSFFSPGDQHVNVAAVPW
jgi:hypothetical protein